MNFCKDQTFTDFTDFHFLDYLDSSSSFFSFFFLNVFSPVPSSFSTQIWIKNSSHKINFQSFEHCICTSISNSNLHLSNEIFLSLSLSLPFFLSSFLSLSLFFNCCYPATDDFPLTLLFPPIPGANDKHLSWFFNSTSQSYEYIMSDMNEHGIMWRKKWERKRVKRNRNNILASKYRVERMLIENVISYIPDHQNADKFQSTLIPNFSLPLSLSSFTLSLFLSSIHVIFSHVWE